MKIRDDIIFLKEKRALTPDDFALPETLGNPSKRTKKALDSCFKPVRDILSHTLDQLGEEGLPTFLGYGTLTGLTQNGLIRAGVSMRAKEMTRKWGKFVSAGDSDNKLEADDKSNLLKDLDKECERFNVKDMFERCANFSGYYGGCLLFIDNGDPEQEWANPLTLSKETFAIGSLRGFKLIEPFVVTPGTYNSINPMSDNYYKPDLWIVHGKPVHRSRMLYFAENDLPTWLKPAYNFFGIPLAQIVLDGVAHFTANRESASRLLQKYATTVFKTDMDEVLNGGFGQELRKRIDFYVQNRDNDGVAVIDKEREDLITMTTSLTGVTDLVRQSMEYVAALFNEPVTKMWGLSPAGFNTGDSDMQSHYDNIASLQHDMFDAPIARITKILQLNKFGEVDDSIRFEFAPLSEDDEEKKVANNKTKAETDAIYMEAGTISPEEARQRLIDDPDSGYNNLEPYESPVPTGDPLEPFDPSLDPDEPAERKDVVVV